MTPERERQIRETLAGHATCARAECQAWRASVTDLLEELDDARAVVRDLRGDLETSREWSKYSTAELVSLQKRVEQVRRLLEETEPGGQG